MRTLGAILAGGQSRRFGSDKAGALLAGQTLLARTLETLRPHCDAVVIVGRADAEVPGIADWPRAGMGPLGGVAGALRHAAAEGFDQLLTLPVDCAFAPTDLRARLEPAPAFSAEQPVAGLWPVASLAALETILAGDGRHSMRVFIERIGARAVEGLNLPNINSIADLLVAEEGIADAAERSILPPDPAGRESGDGD